MNLAVFEFSFLILWKESPPVQPGESTGKICTGYRVEI